MAQHQHKIPAMHANPATCQLGTLYTVGYAHRDGPATVERLMQHAGIRLLDIRFLPRSRWYPAWNYRTLHTTYGDAYQWDRRLGNLNYRYRELPIVLAEGYEIAVREATALLCDGTSLILMCACANPHACHRTIVAKLIQDAMSAMQYPQARAHYVPLSPEVTTLDCSEPFQAAIRHVHTDKEV